MNFSDKLIFEFLKSSFEDSKTRVNPNVTVLVGEIMRLLTTEGAMRAAHQAKQEGSDTVTVEHLEKILSQLLLDFL
ncbi:centromere protein X-like [Portunus trituberculatus]|uniref:centromere protein X-like n=1 Tax=Portunus trituberculatus TaxID=210409 RepID=UPI001E1CC0AA|nr:centromere protein X-like [Portunus trituberculatus]